MTDLPQPGPPLLPPMRGGGPTHPLVPTGVVAATGQPPDSSRPPEVTWMTSGYDLLEHAFERLGDPFSQALCEHSVPTGRLSDLAAARCITCVLVYGHLLTEHYGDPGGYFE
jgi:hypothetical protein